MGKKWIDNRWTVIFVGWIAFGLRIFNLNGRPPWYDESFAMLYAEKSFATMFYGTTTLVNGAASDIHPLFYYSLLHSWMAGLGQTLFAIRFLSVVLSVLTVFIAYAIARYLFGERVGLVTAVIITLSPFSIYYAQETRMYALLGFMAMSAAGMFIHAWQTDKWRFWIGYSVFGAFTLYAHNLGAMYIAGFGLWALYQWARKRKLLHLRQLIVSHIVMLIIFAPWLTILPQQIGKIQQNYWITKPNIVDLLQTSLIFHFAYDNQPLPPALLPIAFFFSILLPIFLMMEFRRRDLEIKTKFDGVISLLVFLLIAPILLTFLISQIKPIYIIRPLLPSAQIYYILVAVFLTVGKMPRVLKWGIVLPMLVVTGLSIYNHHTYTGFPRAPFDEVATYLRQESDREDGVIVHNNKMSYFSTHYYDRNLQQLFIADEPGSGADSLAYPTQTALGIFATDDMKTAVSPYDHIWYIHLSSNTDEDAPLPTDVQWLSTQFTPAGSRQFQNITIYIFERDE